MGHFDNHGALRLDWSLKKLAVFAVVVSAVATVAGFAIDVEAFAGNLLAETAGILLGAVLAVLIVDRAVEHDRARRWSLVADQTLATLRLVVIRAAMDVYMSLPAPRPSDADPYTFGHAGGEGQLTTSLHRLADTVRADAGRLDEEALVSKIRDHLQVVRGGVLPQLLAIGRQDLIARLTTLEMAFQNLENTAWLEQRFGGLNQFHEDLGELLEGLAGVSEEVDRSTATKA
jgi:hypothetical protein